MGVTRKRKTSLNIWARQLGSREESGRIRDKATFTGAVVGQFRSCHGARGRWWLGSLASEFRIGFSSARSTRGLVAALAMKKPLLHKGVVFLDCFSALRTVTCACNVLDVTSGHGGFEGTSSVTRFVSMGSAQQHTSGAHSMLRAKLPLALPLLLTLLLNPPRLHSYTRAHVHTFTRTRLHTCTPTHLHTCTRAHVPCAHLPTYPLTTYPVFPSNTHDFSSWAKASLERNYSMKNKPNKTFDPHERLEPRTQEPYKTMEQPLAKVRARKIATKILGHNNWGKPRFVDRARKLNLQGTPKHGT